MKHFEVPLKASGFDDKKVFVEWRSLQTTVKTSFSHLECHAIWEKIALHRKKETINGHVFVE